MKTGVPRFKNHFLSRVNYYQLKIGAQKQLVFNLKKIYTQMNYYIIMMIPYVHNEAKIAFHTCV